MSRFSLQNPFYDREIDSMRYSNSYHSPRVNTPSSQSCSNCSVQTSNSAIHSNSMNPNQYSTFNNMNIPNALNMHNMPSALPVLPFSNNFMMQNDIQFPSGVAKQSYSILVKSPNQTKAVYYVQDKQGYTKTVNVETNNLPLVLDKQMNLYGSENENDFLIKTIYESQLGENNLTANKPSRLSKNILTNFDVKIIILTQ